MNRYSKRLYYHAFGILSNKEMAEEVAAVVIMFFAAMAGYFVGAALQEEMGGAILFTVITGFACVIYNMDNRE